MIVSKNNPATSLRLWSAIKHHKLGIQRAILTGGAPTAPYLRAFDMDLFLSASPADVSQAMSAGIAAGLIYPTPWTLADPRDQIRIAFDGDAVLFSDESERIFREKGLPAFHEHESRNAHIPLTDGPFAKLLRTLSLLQGEIPAESSPIRLALVTSRGLPAHERVIRTLHAWNVRIDEAFFMGGVSKLPILESFNPHIYFDDQECHCGPVSSLVPTARVPLLLNVPAERREETPGPPPGNGP